MCVYTALAYRRSDNEEMFAATWQHIFIVHTVTRQSTLVIRVEAQLEYCDLQSTDGGECWFALHFCFNTKAVRSPILTCTLVVSCVGRVVTAVAMTIQRRVVWYQFAYIFSRVQSGYTAFSS
jgi:hypothetical protein